MDQRVFFEIEILSSKRLAIQFQDSKTLICSKFTKRRVFLVESIQNCIRYILWLGSDLQTIERFNSHMITIDGDFQPVCCIHLHLRDDFPSDSIIVLNRVDGLQWENDPCTCMSKDLERIQYFTETKGKQYNDGPFNRRIRIPLKMSSLLEIVHHHQSSSISQNMNFQNPKFGSKNLHRLGRWDPRFPTFGTQDATVRCACGNFTSRWIDFPRSRLAGVLGRGL